MLYDSPPHCHETLEALVSILSPQEGDVNLWEGNQTGRKDGGFHPRLSS